MPNPILVTKPFLPNIQDYHQKLLELWQSRVLTNNGELSQHLEKQLTEQLGVKNLSLINNGTISLELAIQALELKGKIITTPYTFIATANSILLKGLEPIFIDIEDNGFNLDPELIDEIKDKDVSAIMPVHVYGLPCDDESIGQRAKGRGLKVIYDAAHAFGIKKKGESILNWGDASTLSFHATKVFHTFEGGAVVSQDISIKNKIDQLKNFGYEAGVDITALGTNGKMNEAQAAMGLALIPYLEEIITKRKHWFNFYIEQLSEIPGIKLMTIPSDLEYNYSYFPILVQSGFSLTRDELFNRFQEENIFPRKYFYPLITDFSLYKNYNIISKHKIPNARKIADSVICLPLYPDLTEDDVSRVCEVIKKSSKCRSSKFKVQSAGVQELDSED
jgi:dTDP-4-amino-4,6-dideoxygalactose transaminase